MNLLFTLNRNYIRQMEICLSSLIRFPSDDGYDIYILHSDLEPTDESRIQTVFQDKEEIQFHFMFVDPVLFEAFPNNDRYPKTMYYRILAPSLLPEKLDRILYLDPDIVAIKPVQSLYNMDFENNYYIACSHTQEFLNQFNRLRLGISENCSYINTGVMMLNLPLLRKEQSLKEIIEYIQRKGEHFLLPDQDIITGLYGNRIKLEDTMIYNLSDRILSFHLWETKSEKSPLDWVEKNTVLIHYCGKNKPWLDNYKGALGIYYKEIETLFP